MKRENKIKLWVAIALFIAMGLITLDLMAQQSAVRNHTKLQKEYSFEVRLKQSDAFTIKSLKEDRRSAKKMNRKNRKQANEQAKVNRIKQDIIELKSKD